MSEDLHHIDKIFRDSIDGHEEEPSPQVWSAIESNLDKSKIKSITRKYNVIKRMTILLFLLLLGITIYDLGIRHPGGKITNKNTNSNINGSVTIQNTISKSDNNNLPKKTIQETENIRRENKIPGDDVARLDNGRTKTINDEHTTRVTGEDKEGENGNLVQKNKTTQNVIVKEVNKPDIIIPLAIPKTEKPTLQSLSAVKKMTILVPGDSITENGKSRHLRQSRFSVTIFFSPDFPFYRLENDPPDNQSSNNIIKAEKPDLSTTTGIWIDYRLNDHWVLQTGANYSNAMIQIEPKIIYAEKDNTGDIKYRYNASSGYGYLLPSFANSPNVGDSLNAFTATHTLRYLNIPMAAKYTLKSGKFNFFASAGVSSGILLQGIIEAEVGNNSNNEVELMDHLHGLKKIYFSGLLSIGAEYKLSSRFYLLVSPTRRFAINSINENAPVKSYPNAFGIAAGVRMNF